MTTYIVINKRIKYDGKWFEIGDEIVPTGGKWDYKLFDPAYKYVRIEKDKPAPKKKVTKPKAVKKKAPAKKGKHKCDYCDRTFEKPQGRSAHMRFCKEKE